MKYAPLLLLLLACASAPPPPPPPALTEIPRGVLDAFCARLHDDEGLSPETTVDVVTTTQPLITPAAISGLAEAAFYTKSFDPAALAEAANGDEVPLPVVVPRGTCAWRGVDEAKARAADIMTIDLSSPFRNPFARGSYGILVRLSLARDSATWYWVPLGAVNGRWAVGRPMLLSMR